VLWDESRVATLPEDDQEYLMKEADFARDTDWSFSCENYDESWGFGNFGKKIQEIASVDVRKSGKLSYSVLRNYDVLIISSFEKSYSTAEASAIRKFVENGGGLLVCGDPEGPNNRVSRSFDILFPSKTVIIADQTIGKSSTKNFPFEKKGDNARCTQDVLHYCIRF